MKLNLGSGVTYLLDGYENRDAKNGKSVYPLAGIMRETVEEVRASHVLEHYAHAYVPRVLEEWVRALKPGAWLKIAVPDLEAIARELLAGNPRALPLDAYLMGGQTDELDFHKSVFNRATLEKEMKQAGLTDIQLWQSEIQDCASLPISLNLMGQKPLSPMSDAEVNRAIWNDGAPDHLKRPMPNGNYDAARHFVNGEWRDKEALVKDTIKIVPGSCAVVVSSPRYGSLLACDVMWGVIATLRAHNHRGGGAWWEQGLSNQIEDCLEQKDEKGNPTEFIISMDFDSYTHPNDIVEMLRLLFQNPQYDCIVPTQARRGSYQEVLAKINQGVDLNQALIPIVTGHFGLTLFRRRVFERLPKPWMLNVPNDEGRWRDGNTDADIYFWNKFNDCGFKAALATQVIIGHGDETIAWPTVVNGKMVKIYQNMYDWFKTRKPPAEVSLVEAKEVV